MTAVFGNFRDANDWKYIHEPLIFGWRKDGAHVWYGDNGRHDCHYDDSRYTIVNLHALF